MDTIHFTINGDRYDIAGSQVSVDMTLSDFLRYSAGLCGTKTMCQEGGCGACIVSVSATHPSSGEKRVFAVNSCLVHILSCHGWDITTIEGIGNRSDGYHPIQTRLSEYNGTQCGYCSPGWVMNMYSLQKSQKTLTMKQVETSFGSNMCRCTGYRPILDALKSFANDTENTMKDIEDTYAMKCQKKCDQPCPVSSDDEWCLIEKPQREEPLSLNAKESRWYKAFKVQDLFKILRTEGVNDYRLVNGNTGRGVYPTTTTVKILIDISSISTLKESFTDVNLIVGAGMTLTEVIETFRSSVKSSGDFKYLEEFVRHLEQVAHVPVRNIGTIGGNLALKNLQNAFPSDIFIIMETVGATVTIMDKELKREQVKMPDFLKMDLTAKLIHDVMLPPLSKDFFIRTYKISFRAQNAHAIVNAGFLFKLTSNKVEYTNIVYGSISPDFIHAKETEDKLKGLVLFEENTLKLGLNTLSEELNPVEVAPEPSASCKKMIALGLFYKTILTLAPPDAVNPRFKSGGSTLSRDVSRGTQVFDTDKTLWPLNQPIPKMDALTQTAGEAVFADDVTPSIRDVHLAFVLSTICRGEIDSIDTATVMKIPGVMCILTAKDIPGKNSFTSTKVPWIEADEEVLASKTIIYYGQPVAIVGAVTRKLALKVAKEVKVEYKNVSKDKPVLSIQEALVAPDKNDRIRPDILIEAKEKGTDTTKVIIGEFSVPSQYHYTMETQTCRASMSEHGVDMVVSTQWMDLVQIAVADLLGLKENQINITINRLGGAYGGKASRSSLIACACALAAFKLDRRARLVLPIADNMAAVGKRQACYCRFEVGTNDEGLIQYLQATYYTDTGHGFNDSPGGGIAGTMTNLYSSQRWRIEGNSVRTDKANNTWCRAPGTTESTAIVEHIMERIAFATKKDPTDVKLLNLNQDNAPIKEMVLSFKVDTKYDERRAEIDKYNKENAWKKRGLKLSLMSYPVSYAGNFPVIISVYHADGTIAISHGGIEMGQGINTKVAQVCAYSLKIPLDKVTVKPVNNLVAANAFVTSSSTTSELVAYAVMKACEDLLKRLEKIKEDMNEPVWEDVVKKAYDTGINLQATYMYGAQDPLVGYNVYGATLCEVHLDLLSGTHQVTRVDLLEDTGRSLSQTLDVGQIEGAFIMGLGLWTTEELIYEPSTGRLLTDRTWTYKPPGVMDIPVDFRVSFRRNSLNPAGVLRSKATGEPSLTMAVVVIHALHEAIMEGRKEFGYEDSEWVHVDTPYSVDNIVRAISPKIEKYTLK